MFYRILIIYIHVWLSAAIFYIHYSIKHIAFFAEYALLTTIVISI